MMTVTTQNAGQASDGRRASLRDLTCVELNSRNRRLLDFAHNRSGGSPAWRGRKEAEARELLALSQIAPPGRLTVQLLRLEESVRALLVMRVPVPCLPDSNNHLRIANQAVLGLTYPEEALRQRLPGVAFFQLLEPQGAWHASIDPVFQRICLGASIPANTPVRNLVTMAFGALCMQTAQVDELDPAGVLNADAARWWQQNLHLAPLTKTPFLVDEPSGSVMKEAKSHVEQPEIP